MIFSSISTEESLFTMLFIRNKSSFITSFDSSVPKYSSNLGLLIFLFLNIVIIFSLFFNTLSILFPPIFTY